MSKSLHAAGGFRPSARFDLGFAPAGYGDFPGPIEAATGEIKGRMRREMARDLIAHPSSILGEIEEGLLGQNAPEGFVPLLSRMDPRWLGGEFLPDVRAREVEIARICLDSVTWDVFSVRARRGTRCWRYRIVDEYEERWTLRVQTSRRPLTMGRLIVLIDTASFWGYEGTDLTDAYRNSSGDSDFVTVESVLYPQLQEYYEEKAEAWEARRGQVTALEGL